MVERKYSDPRARAAARAPEGSLPERRGTLFVGFGRCSIPCPRPWGLFGWGLLVLVLFVPGSVNAGPEDWPPEASAVLERFLGTWKTETRMRRLGPTSREYRTEGQAECRRTLGGRYFEFRSRSVGDDRGDLQIMTYDAQAKVYRQWLFDATDTGTQPWDAGTRPAPPSCGRERPRIQHSSSAITGGPPSAWSGHWSAKRTTGAAYRRSKASSHELTAASPRGV